MTYDRKNYLQAAVAGAGPVGLVVLLYDRLVSDLSRAVAAMENGDVEKRVAEINHAFLILGQLEGSLDSTQAPEAARTQALFYQVARNRILEAHLKSSREMLAEQIALFNDVRAAWEQAERVRNGRLSAGSPPPKTSGNPEADDLASLDASA